MARNSRTRHCRAVAADAKAWGRAQRPKPCRLATAPELQSAVANKLVLDWSPEQIAGRLKQEYLEDGQMHGSHETIHKGPYIQARGALRKELPKHLRPRRMVRRGKPSSTDGQPRGQVMDAVPISLRPPEVEGRAVPGHWEGDLTTGPKNSHIAALVERRPRFVLPVQTGGKGTAGVVGALVRQVKQLPVGLMATLTWGRGAGLAQPKRFTLATDVAMYFCGPRGPWRRGTNENTNRLLRQYFPKGTDLGGHAQQDLDEVALRPNTRPGKTLGYVTPGDKLYECVAMTG